MTIDDLTKDIMRLGTILAPRYSERDNGVSIWYQPNPPAHVVERLGQVDPWNARWSGHTGTGATAEMALLELRASIQSKLDEAIAYERERIAEATKRLAALRALESNTNPSDGSNG